jgi:hypothetical protein
LQEALSVANAAPERTTRGIEIRISQGVYRPDHGTLSPAASFVLNSGVTLMGGFAGLLGAIPDLRDPKQFVSVLSGDLNDDDGPNFTGYDDNSRTIVRAAFSNVLDGLEISGGNAEQNAPLYISTPGVIWSPSTTPANGLIIRNCSIVRNRAVTAPVVFLGAGRAESCRINGNKTFNTSVVSTRSSDFHSCEIRGNRVISTTVTGIATVYILGSQSGVASDSFVRCLIADNIGGALGAVYGSDPTVPINVRGCTFARNSAPLSEALASVGSMLVRNSIFSGNVRSSIPETATQIFAPNPGMLDMNDSDLVDNGALGFRFTSSVGGAPHTLSGDPMFVSPNGRDHDAAGWADNNYHLRPGSPAMDRADFGYATFTDLDGVPLYDTPGAPNLGSGQYTYADLGCFEFTGKLCDIDFNRSGTIGVDDIFDFLNAWLASQPGADFNGGGLSVQDIFDFINAWLAGC